MSNEISENQNNKPKITFADFMTTNIITNKVNNIVGDDKRGARFISGIISAVNTNPTLQECNNQSILSAALLGESLNLSPSPQLGMYYMVPYNDRERGKVATFQLGWKGYYQLALRSGQYKKLNVIEIKDGELIKWNPLEEEIELNMIEDDSIRENTKTIGYYAFYENLQGFRKAMYWSKEKMESHALQYSMGYKAKKGYTFWEKNFDEMAKKTMLRQLISKYGVMSIDMQTAYMNDMAMIDEKGKTIYVDIQEEKPKNSQKVVKTLDDIE